MRYTNHPITYVLLAVFTVVSLVGCDSLTDGYDRDPNEATEAPLDPILTGGQVNSILLQDGNLARLAGIWSGYFTGSDRQYTAVQVYSVTASDFDSMWELAYADVVAQMRLIQAEVAAQEAPNRFVGGIARTVEALTFGTMTSTFGDIPFTQASNVDEFPNPEFDSQASVYEGVQGLLDQAIADFESGQGISPEGKDIFFSGDVSKWTEVAHTLKARYHLHTGNYAQAAAEARLGISEPANNMIAPHDGATGVNANPYWLFMEVERTGYMTAATAHAVDLLEERQNAKTNETGRTNFYYFGFGEGETVAPNTGDNPVGFFATDADFPIVTWAENQLILAEAVLLSGGGSVAAQTEALGLLNEVRAELQARYQEGTSAAASYGAGQYEAYVLADFAPGGIANTEGESQANALLREVLEEKYFALYGNIEVWNDIRRTDNFLSIPPNTGDELPQRFLYSQVEVNSNSNLTDSDVLTVFDETPVNAASEYTGL